MNLKDQTEIRPSIAALCDQCLQSTIARLKGLNNSENTPDSDALKRSGNDRQSSVYQPEIQLWVQLKKYIGGGEKHVVNDIHGFYAYLLQVVSILIDTSTKDVYFSKWNPASITKSIDEERSKKGSSDVQLLLYNINIRLGDLNRYLKNTKMAQHHYHQAREINPLRGHAYNQLALVSTSDILKTLYFSTRALLAVEDPVKNADATIKSLAKKCSLLDPNIDILFGNCDEEFDTSRVENWLYIVVLVIYCEKFKLVLPHLVRKASELLRAPIDQSSGFLRVPDDENWVFSSLEVLVDIIHQEITREKLSNLDFETDFNDLLPLLSYYSDRNRSEQESDFVALKHDFILNGFFPLKPIHDVLNFTQPPNDEQNVKFLIYRLSQKIDKILKLISDKKSKAKAKKRRNIALQSILDSKGSF